MAENIDSPSLFSIQDTMEMGMGNQQLLSDLFAPEIATSNPDDIQKIDKPSPPPEKKTEAPAKAAAPTTTEETPAIDEKKSITDFLMNDEEEKEALIGVSMTGIASGGILKLNMKEAANIVKE